MSSNCAIQSKWSSIDPGFKQLKDKKSDTWSDGDRNFAISACSRLYSILPLQSYSNQQIYSLLTGDCNKIINDGNFRIILNKQYWTWSGDNRNAAVVILQNAGVPTDIAPKLSNYTMWNILNTAQSTIPFNSATSKWYVYPNFNENDKDKRYMMLDADRIYEGEKIKGRKSVAPKCKEAIEKIDCNNDEDYLNDDLDSFKLDPGLQLCLYNAPNYGTNENHSCFPDVSSGSIEIRNLQNYPINSNSTSSFKINKDCSHPSRIWDDDCNKSAENTINVDKLDSTKSNVCNKADLFSDLNCQEWCLKNPEKCSNSLVNFCNSDDGIKLPECQKLCKSKNGQGKCDAAAEKYCANNLSDNDFCSCYDENAYKALPDKLKNVAQYKNSKAICYSGKCAQSGYLSTNMSTVIKDTCPKCLQSVDFNSLDLKNSQALIDNIKLTCQNETTVQGAQQLTSSPSKGDTSKLGKDDTSSPDTKSTTTTISPSSDTYFGVSWLNQTNLIIIIVVIVLIFLFSSSSIGIFLLR